MLELDCIERALARTGWNRARVKFLARFLVALFAVKTVCLTQIATAFPGAALPDSSYKRLQRFLHGFDIDAGATARLIASLLGVEGPWTLALDRTNWKLGRAELNLLVLALVHEGVAFPLFWTALGRAGNSNTEQRMALLRQFVSEFGKERIAFLCADREFLGKRWVGWLVQESVPFRLRVKADTLLANGRGEMVCADWLFRDCPVQSERQLPHPRRCLGQQVFVCGTRLADGEFLIVIADDARACLADYGKRWGIETLFGALKRRGFNLEATHVTASDRLCRLLTLLSIAFCWAFAAGRWLTEQKPLRLAKRKKHGRKAIGVFRLGFDWLRRLLLPLSGLFRQADYQFALRFLSCT
jgi:hypothetical protein